MSDVNVSGLPVNTILFALSVGAFAIGTDAFVAIGLVQEIASDMRISEALSGQLVSIFAFCYAIFAPIAAVLFTSICRKKVLLLAISLFALGNIICALASDAPLIFLGRVVAAAGAASFTPQATAVATSLVTVERRATALAIVFGGMTIAGAVGAPLGAFIGQVAGWRIAFLTVAAVGMVSFVMLSVLLHPIEGDGAHGLLDRLEPVRNGIVQLVLLVTFFIVLSEYVIYSYISVLLDDIGIGGFNILPGALAMFGIGAIVGNIATAILTDRLGSRRVIFVAILCQTICLVLLIWLRKIPWAVLIIAFAWGVFSYMYLVPIQHRLLDLSKKFGAFTISLNSSVIYLGIASGGGIGGLVVASFDIEALALVAVASSVAAFLMAALAFPKPR